MKYRVILCRATLAVAIRCGADQKAAPPAHEPPNRGVATTVVVPTASPAAARDTFTVITDSMAVAARAAGTMLPRIDQHFDAGVVATRGEDVCFRYPRYTVVQRHITDGIAYDLLVRAARADAPPQQRCVTDSLPGDFVVREQDRVIGMLGDTLWAESGEMISDLTLYDVTRRAKLLELPGYEIVAWRDDVTLALWVSAGTATRADCPNVPKSLDPERDSLYLLHLASLRLEPEGHERCIARQ